MTIKLMLEPARAALGLLAALGLAAGPAHALPETFAQAEINLWYGGPADNRTVTGRSNGIIPLDFGVGRVDRNGSQTRAMFVGPTGNSGPGLGLVPGQPGPVWVELGVRSMLFTGANLTVSGLPGDDVVDPMWRDSTGALARYRDQVTFVDAALPPGAPLTVNLQYYLSSDTCGGAAVHLAPICVVPLPPGVNPGDPLATPLALLSLSSSVTLPGGVDTAAVTRTVSTPMFDPSIAPGGTPLGGATLTHSFTVANGATHDFEMQLQSVLVFDGLDFIDGPGASPRARWGEVMTVYDLDYLGTMHLGTIEAFDAEGRALPGFEMRNSLGWTLQATPPVPEPAGWLLMATGLLLVGWRRRQQPGLVAALVAVLPLVGCFSGSEGPPLPRVEPEAVTAQGSTTLDLSAAGAGTVVLRFEAQVRVSQTQTVISSGAFTCAGDENFRLSMRPAPPSVMARRADGSVGPMPGLSYEAEPGNDPRCADDTRRNPPTDAVVTVPFVLRVSDPASLAQLAPGPLVLLPSVRVCFVEHGLGDSELDCAQVEQQLAVQIVAVPAAPATNTRLDLLVQGDGRVTSQPAGIDCGADCSETFAVGTAVQLTATPGVGSRFTGFAGDADCGDGQLTVTATPLRCEARFTSTAAAWVTLLPSLTQTPASQGAHIFAPALALAGGDPVVAWTEQNRVRVRLPDGTLSVASGGTVSGPPALLLAAGTPWLAWEEETADERGNVRVRRLINGDWADAGPPAVDTQVAQHASSPSLVWHDGAPVLAWLEQDDAGVRHLHVRRWDGVAWVALGSGAVAASDTIQHPILVQGAAGLALAWFEDSGPRVALWSPTGNQWQRLADPLPAGSYVIPERSALAWAGGSLLLAGMPPAGGLFTVRRWAQGSWSDMGVPLGEARAILLDVALAPDAAQPLMVFAQTRASGAVTETLALRWSGSAWVPVGEPLPRVTRHNAPGRTVELAVADAPRPVVANVLQGNVPGGIASDHTLTLARFE